jgi:hypothetical protein
VDSEITAYVTIDGVVHNVVWVDHNDYNSDLVLMCTRKRAPVDTRAKLKRGEAVTCVACIAKEAACKKAT